MAAAAGKAQWSSRTAFILAAVGSSVGLGNLWRFSSEAGTNGGGAFIIVYLAAVLLVATPVLMSEYLIGRSGSYANCVNSIGEVAEKSGRSQAWQLPSWFGMIAGFLIVTFYCVIAGWVVRYIPIMLGNNLEGMGSGEIATEFFNFGSNPMAVLPWFLGFALLTTYLVSRGVNKGIELAARILMPIFFILLIGLAIYAIYFGWSSGATKEALNFLYVPDFNEMLTKDENASALANFGRVSNAALGQAFFSVGVGSAIMITYGSYIPRDVSLPKSAAIVALMDTFVALIAGLAIFPFVFAFNLPEGGGAGLLFITLPNAFEAMGLAGQILGAAFFFLAFFAAITSSTSLLEPSAAFVSERFNMTKAKAAWIVGALMVAIGLISVFGVGLNADGELLTPALDAIDGFTGKIMLPVGGFLIVLFVGWRAKRALIDEQIAGDGEKLGRIIIFLTRWVAPIFVGAVMVTSILDYIQGFLS